jgi:hypothetical protein
LLRRLTAQPLGDDGLPLMASREEQGMNREELAALRDAVDTRAAVEGRGAGTKCHGPGTCFDRRRTELKTAAPEAERLEERGNWVPGGNSTPRTYPPWIRPLACYERREVHEFQMSRYG